MEAYSGNYAAEREEIGRVLGDAAGGAVTSKLQAAFIQPASGLVASSGIDFVHGAMKEHNAKVRMRQLEAGGRKLQLVDGRISLGKPVTYSGPYSGVAAGNDGYEDRINRPDEQKKPDPNKKPDTKAANNNLPPKSLSQFDPNAKPMVGAYVDNTDLLPQVRDLRQKINELELVKEHLPHRNEQIHAQKKIEIYRQKIEDIKTEHQRGFAASGERFESWNQRHKDTSLSDYQRSYRGELDGAGMLLKTGSEELGKLYEKYTPEVLKDPLVDARAVLGMAGDKVAKKINQYGGEHAMEALSWPIKIAVQELDKGLYPGEKVLAEATATGIATGAIGYATGQVIGVVGSVAKKSTKALIPTKSSAIGVGAEPILGFDKNVQPLFERRIGISASLTSRQQLARLGVDLGELPSIENLTKAAASGAKLRANVAGDLAVPGTRKVTGIDLVQQKVKTNPSDPTRVFRELKRSSSLTSIDYLTTKDRIQHEFYKSELRVEMQKPVVQDGQLKSIIKELYRDEPNPIGSGSTAAALRNEILTGQPTKGKFHLIKTQERLVNLKKWISNNPNSFPGDRAAAENVLKDLEDALRNLKQ